MNTVRIANLTFSYDGRPALERITLEIHPGELLALIGPNGSGKTTLLRALSGVLRPQGGAVYLDFTGGNIRPISAIRPKELARLLAALEQETHVAFDFTVEELVSLGRLPHLHKLSPLSTHDRQAVEEAMRRVGVLEFAQRSVQELSGGERRRAFLALALAQKPQILLLDEPTAHLDLKYQIEIMELVRRLTKQGLGVIAALHDLNLAARYADRVAVLCQGRLMACGIPAEVLTLKLIQEVWGVDVEILSRQGGLWILPLPSVVSGRSDTSVGLSIPCASG